MSVLVGVYLYSEKVLWYKQDKLPWLMYMEYFGIMDNIDNK